MALAEANNSVEPEEKAQKRNYDTRKLWRWGLSQAWQHSVIPVNILA